jgi:MOSC domain-containing protein YiiM
MASPGRVESVYITDRAEAPTQTVSEVLAVAGRGLEGDRYFTSSGTYSNHPGDGRHVTLIESEAIDALSRDYHVVLDPGLARRNIVTRGIALNHLVGYDFRLGRVIVRGTRLCEPCAHLEKLTQPGTLRGLIHRGGLRAEILVGGIIRVGDEIRVSNDETF